MTLTGILVFALIALLLAAASRFTRFSNFRNPILLILSLLAVYWLQPVLPIRGLDFWLPTVMILLSAAGWALTTPREAIRWRETLRTGILICGVVLLIALTRYLSAAGLITPSRPPEIGQVLMVLLAGSVLATGLMLLRRKTGTALTVGIVFLIALFVVLKYPPLTQSAAALLRGMAGQSTRLSSALDIRWLGFSYIAFRMIHTLRDRQNGRLPGVSLQEYLIYLLFFPALSAGPIDRIERFLKDLRAPQPLSAPELGEGGRRFISGLFKKFVLADLLGLIALNGSNAALVHSAGWTWVMLYAYSLQIYFDFSGYTDIALGLARWMGIRLPENFNHPYLKSNLTQFWNNWHMTLTQWFRAYFFNPLTRALRGAKKPLPVWVVIFFTQITTMVLIGLWHGISWNFVAWGAWHGVGLFINNRWTDWIKPRAAALESHPGVQRGLNAFTTLLTFQYVALGWVWFALPSLPLSIRTFAMLLGIRA